MKKIGIGIILIGLGIVVGWIGNDILSFLNDYVSPKGVRSERHMSKLHNFDETPFWISKDKIGYVSNSQIWMVELDKLDHIQLSVTGECSSFPPFPIAIADKYVVFIGNTGYLWIVDIATKREKLLVKKKIRWFSSISDRESISYIIEGEKYLHVLNLQTGVDSRIEESIQPYWSWSPDGKRIIYRGRKWWSWSPDGEKIAYRGCEEICIMNVTTGKIKKIAKGGFYPSWSPCGDKIIFFRPCKKIGIWEIWIINHDGKGERLLDKCEKNTGVRKHKIISWSPNGKQFTYDDDKKNGIIWVINVENKKKIRLSKSPYCSSPAWSPDGKRIVFDRLGRIFVATLD